MTFDTLSERFEIKERRVEAVREQKLQDELAQHSTPRYAKSLR
jgi:flagellar biosynthesis chaperone FliJ